MRVYWCLYQCIIHNFLHRNYALVKIGETNEKNVIQENAIKDAPRSPPNHNLLWGCFLLLQEYER